MRALPTTFQRVCDLCTLCAQRLRAAQYYAVVFNQINAEAQARASASARPSGEARLRWGAEDLRVAWAGVRARTALTSMIYECVRCVGDARVSCGAPTCPPSSRVPRTPVSLSHISRICYMASRPFHTPHSRTQDRRSRTQFGKCGMLSAVHRASLIGIRQAREAHV